jgi:hypothetical protein
MSVSDSMIALVRALETARYQTAEFAQQFEIVQPDGFGITTELNWVTAGLLADVLERDSNYTIDQDEIRFALMLLTPAQFEVIIRATAEGKAETLVERINRDGQFPEEW